MRLVCLRSLLLAVPMVSAVAHTLALQMNVVYVCTDGQSFKVFSCDNTTGACDYQNYKKGRRSSEVKRFASNLLLCSRRNATRKRRPKHRPIRIAVRFQLHLLRSRRVPILAATVRDPRQQ